MKDGKKEIKERKERERKMERYDGQEGGRKRGLSLSEMEARED